MSDFHEVYKKASDLAERYLDAEEMVDNVKEKFIDEN